MPRQAIVVKSGQSQPLNVLGTEVRFLCESQDTGNAWSLMELVVPKNGGPAPHVHDWDEAYYITAGEICFTVGAQSITATSGDFIYAPAGILHGFHGASDQDSRMLIVDVPAHAGSFFRQVNSEVVELPRDLPKVLDIATRNGIHFVQAA